MDKRIIEIGKQVRKFLENRYGAKIKATMLYGSHVREKATEDSDVDLLVVVEDSLEPWQVLNRLDNLLFDILLSTGELVSVVVLPMSYYTSYTTPFLMNVRREGIPI